MVVMHVVHAAIHQRVDMISVRNLWVSPAGTMDMIQAACARRASLRCGGAYLDNMLVHMVTVYVMEVAVMQVIDMPIMTRRHVTAVLTMLMAVLNMMLLVAGHHRSPLRKPLLSPRSWR